MKILVETSGRRAAVAIEAASFTVGSDGELYLRKEAGGYAAVFAHGHWYSARVQEVTP